MTLDPKTDGTRGLLMLQPVVFVEDAKSTHTASHRTASLVQVLPKEIIHLILSFEGSIKYRKGRYTNQIVKTDKRYDMFLKIPKPVLYIHPFCDLSQQILLHDFDIIILFSDPIFVMYIGSYNHNEIRYAFTRKDTPLTPNVRYIRI